MSNQPHLELVRAENINMPYQGESDRYYMLMFGDDYSNGYIYINNIDDILPQYKDLTPLKFLDYIDSEYGNGQYREFLDLVAYKGGLLYFGTWIDT
jgi:hypothetical protein